MCRDALAQSRKKQKALSTKACDNCGGVFETTNSKQLYCSKKCREVKNADNAKARSRNYYSQLYPDGIKRKPCGWCGETLEVPAQKTLASRKYHEACSLEAQRARYRIKTVKRQSKTKPSRLAADQVLREYGSACHICREEIDLTLSRTSKMGLTVDHVIPLSKGGSDELDNLRPAHWICNNRKSDKLDA
jgi:5-methylcytosine-specific restriction endonuclease McrA